MIVLWVNKSTLRADLMTWPEDSANSKILSSFKIAIGKEDGDKQAEGDKRTPEGIYFTLNPIDGKTLPSKYGPLAIPINFPNPADRSQGKTGHGIWLHGVEADQRIEAAKVTEGCIAFYNADILVLAKWLKPNNSVVVITKDSVDIRQTFELNQLKKEVTAWTQAWRNRALQDYISHYDKGFIHPIGSLKAYLQHKKRVFAGYRKMEVQISDMRVFSHDSYGMAVMNQLFNGDDRFLTDGRKILYFRKDPEGQWRIIHETFENNRIEFKQFTAQQARDGFKNTTSAKLFGGKGAATIN